MDLGIAQTFSDATWMNIDIWHIEFTFAHGIILQMALHNIEVLYWDFFFCFFLLVGCADAKAPTGCDCETAYQQCRKQNGCNNYYRFLTERMIKRIWAGGSNPGAGSSNPCATCVSISIMTIFDQNQEVYKIYRSIYVMNSSADIIEILHYTLHHCSITSSKLSVIHIFWESK